MVSCPLAPSTSIGLRYQAKPTYDGWVCAPQVLSPRSCSQLESLWSGLAHARSSPVWNLQFPPTSTNPLPGSWILKVIES